MNQNKQEQELLEILPMGGHVPLDTTEVRKKILKLLIKTRQEAVEGEQKRLANLIGKIGRNAVTDLLLKYQEEV